MENDKEIKTKKSKNAFGMIIKWFAFLATIFFIFAIIAVTSAFFYEKYHANKIFPGITLGNISLGGKTQKEAATIINLKRDKILSDGITFLYQSKKLVVPAEIFASDPDLSKTIISVDTARGIKEAYGYGRSGHWMQNAISQAYNAIYGKRIPLEYTLEEREIKSILENDFKIFENPAQDAKLKIEKGDVAIIPEREGMIFDYDTAISQLKKNLSSLEGDPIELSLIVSRPRIFAEESQMALNSAKVFINTTTPELVHDTHRWKITEKQLMEWIEFSIPEKKLKNNYQKQVGLQFNYKGLSILLDEIASEINIEPADAKFEMVDGRVTQFQISRAGEKVDVEKNYKKINQQFFEEKKNTIELTVDISLPKVSTDVVNNLGIKELLGVGKSNFAGSPKNRRLNIANGAKLLNGIIIKPGEEFSLLKALKPFDQTNGYLPELVIKGDRTIPEYGGGLCQIGTTTFRATLYSGLPVKERKNHSYRVVYYEPAGMDATIYDPAPDFKLINDTPAHLLLTTEISGDDLIFRFYGTNDGRKAEVTAPRIFNVTSPGEPRLIETEELAPGEKKLVEKPHKGADAEFNYTVTYADGRIEKKTFFSRYVAWREAWLVGKEPTPVITEENTSPDSALPLPAQETEPVNEDLINSFN